MVSSAAKTVPQYLADLPEDRRKVIAAVRRMVRKHLPPGYQETMNWGMISYEIPLKRHSPTYNGQPLVYIGLAAQKNNYALYLTNVYQDKAKATWLREQFRKAGKKLDMGKSCLRFRKLEDLPLEALGKIVASTSVEAHIARHQKSHSS